MKAAMREIRSQLCRLAGLASMHLAPAGAEVEERKMGGLEGQIWMSEDFDDEDEELIEAIENSKIFPDED